VIVNMTNDSFELLRSSSESATGKWHLLRESQDRSVCGRMERSGRASGVSPRSIDLNHDTMVEVKGLGQVCKLCHEYVAGSMEERNIPKPAKGGKKKKSIVDEFKGEDKKTVGEIYGQ